MSPTPRPSPAHALAAATAALVQPYDITDVLAGMLPEVTTALGGRAAGLLVRQPGGELELLASTSHAATEIELYQTQSDEGPCVDCVRALRPVGAHGRDTMCSRWPELGPAMVAAGYLGVHAEPLRWHGRALGGLNVFFQDEQPLPEDTLALVRAFADIMTLALVQTQQPSDRELAAHLREALDSRIVIEHAKGVLMHAEGLDPETAYTTLRTRANDKGVAVTDLARKLVWRAQTP
ncbi:GAF and ANTAR domain-containing protein [Ornithinimicrobium cavernae]|uniref:GAF and ANTAR domain-containing protein n=1 Tax=Ornithinimicrobium cavernae TaxID=2666047 RepID=UPI000D686A95|nr:GAF and ANTAR domain-containing protein [Ornithinimicrobium cavernae]